MRLLICVQAVDTDDRLMGFFVEWLENAARVFSRIDVLTLRVGRHALPAHVQVHALRADQNKKTKFEVLKNLFSISWKFRHEYDAVYVRGDAIYVLLAGWFWRLLKKPVVLWYAHYKANALIPWANRIANKIVTSVPEACAYPGVTPLPIGQAIDETRFSPKADTVHEPVRLLVFGRVQRIKGVKEIVQEFIREGAFGGKAVLHLVGPTLEPDYAAEIEALMQGRTDITWEKDGIPYDEIPAMLTKYDILVNAYPGSLDKAIIESMMSGIIPVVATKGLCHSLPAEWRWMVAETPEERVRAVRKILSLAPEERARYAVRVREIAVRDHSMSKQIERLEQLFTKLV
ncbi:MAG: hypothetical protein U0487_03605 [Patescibacteria group bacterium]